jgi:hypothetical protein
MEPLGKLLGGPYPVEKIVVYYTRPNGESSLMQPGTGITAEKMWEERLIIDIDIPKNFEGAVEIREHTGEGREPEPGEKVLDVPVERAGARAREG